MAEMLSPWVQTHFFLYKTKHIHTHIHRNYDYNGNHVYIFYKLVNLLLKFQRKNDLSFFYFNP